MGDFAAGGLREPMETDEATANEGYLSQPPAWGNYFGNLFMRESARSGVEWLARHAEHGQFAGSSDWDHLIRAVVDPFPNDITAPGLPSPMMSADEINRRYAAPGTKIAEKPMPQDVGRMLGEEQSDDMRRDDVIARYENEHSWYQNIPTGIAAFMLDPLHLSTAFVPGLGEDMLLARFGLAGARGLGGFAARTAARAIAGGSAGIAAQAPLSGLAYAVSQDEGATDYDLRAAMNDMANAAIGGAVFHAGFAGAADILHWRFPNRAMPPGVTERPMKSLMFGRPGADVELEDMYLADIAKSVEKWRGELTGEEPPLSIKDVDLEERYLHNLATGADREANFRGIRTAIAQLASGEQVDVMPVFDEAEAANRGRVEQLDAEINKRTEEIERLRKEAGLGALGVRLGERAASVLTGETPEALAQARGAPGREATERLAQLEQIVAAMTRERDMIQRLRTEGRTETALRQPIMGPAELAATQKLAFARGFTPWGTRRFEPDWAAQRAARESVRTPERPTQWPPHLPQPGAPMPEVKPPAAPAPAAAEGAKPAEAPPPEKPPGEGPPAPGAKPAEGEKPAAEEAPTLGQGSIPADAASDMAIAGNMFQRMAKEIGIDAETQPLIEKADEAMAKAKTFGELFAQAAQCLVEGGL